MPKINVEVSIMIPRESEEKYDTTEKFETSFQGSQEEYLYLIANIIPMLKKEV